MSAYGDIVSAIMRIMRAVDTQDRELFRDGWAEDVDFQVAFFGQEPLRIQGRDSMVERFTGAWTGQPAKLRHQVSAVQVDMLGEGRAKAFFYSTYVSVGETAVFAGMGEYEDELVRCADGRWRVAVRRHRFLTPLPH